MGKDIEVTVNRDDLLAVLKAWASPDDWDVPSIYVSTVEELVDLLVAGADPFVLAKHAKHVGINCCRFYVDPAVRFEAAEDPVCEHCGETLTFDRGVWTDPTGGDVCGYASAFTVGENVLHKAHESIGDAIKAKKGS